MVLAFSGKIGSGKSSVSVAVADGLHLPWVSFGNYVRKRAKAQELEPTRQHLQDLGQALLLADADAFCAAVLAQAPDVENGLVVDGYSTLLFLVIDFEQVVSSSSSAAFQPVGPTGPRAGLAGG